MFALARRAEEKGVTTQIILIDNDVPPQIPTQFADAIVAHFNNEGAHGLARGLIDDAYLFEMFDEVLTTTAVNRFELAPVGGRSLHGRPWRNMVIYS